MRRLTAVVRSFDSGACHRFTPHSPRRSRVFLMFQKANIAVEALGVRVLNDHYSRGAV